MLVTSEPMKNTWLRAAGMNWKAGPVLIRVRPSYNSVSLLSSSTLERQLPVMLAPLKVSPKASWVSPLSPLSHMTPTSVP